MAIIYQYTSSLGPRILCTGTYARFSINTPPLSVLQGDYPILSDADGPAAARRLPAVPRSFAAQPERKVCKHGRLDVADKRRMAARSPFPPIYNVCNALIERIPVPQRAGPVSSRELGRNRIGSGADCAPSSCGYTGSVPLDLAQGGLEQ